MKVIAPQVIKQLFIIFLILIIGSLIFSKTIPYLSGLLGAITLFVLLKKSMDKLVNKKWSPNSAALFLMFTSFVAILLPIMGILLMLGNKIKKASENFEEIIEGVKGQLNELEKYIGYDLASSINTSELSKTLSEQLQNLIGGTFNTLMVITIMYFLLYYMLINYNKLNTLIYNYIPLKNKNCKLLEQETTAMVKANALGIPLVAIAQGLVSLVGFLIFKTDNPFFWAVIVTVGSMIPFIGSMLGTIPVFLLTFDNGDVFNAWAILAYGIIFVGATDNIIRLFILQKLDDVHPLITLFGVIIGIPLFGFIGLIFGPLLISLFFVIVRIYKNEYSNNDESLVTAKN